PEKFDEDKYWITVDLYASNDKQVREFSHKLDDNISNQYYRVVLDTKGSKYDFVYLPELQIIGYQLPAADLVMAMLATAEELSQQKDKFSQEQLKELETKVAALKASLDSKMFNADAINASAADLKAYVDKLLADRTNQEKAAKAAKVEHPVATDIKENTESEKSKAD
ncbi:TPA: endo-beta-N-acetylglucosaminidase, partial [Streptococcus equi subsp. zooepidemicus]|nr:endo-beta-N-acetylglucosaminidase [Streptococcus equi subsp. zooepidemicus]